MRIELSFWLVNVIFQSFRCDDALYSLVKTFSLAVLSNYEMDFW